MHRSGILFVGLLMFAGLATAADETKKAPRFELKDGDRVVLLGGTLIEREQKYGHWEAMLTARYPDRNITFRNLGWDGDTVWAESRGIFETPEVGYARMIEQVKGLKPTVIFLGYGNNEAFAGKKGLEPFIKQYEKLIDDLTRVSAEGLRFVFLAPTQLPVMEAPFPDVTVVNELTHLYGGAISELSTRRNFGFLELVDPRDGADFKNAFFNTMCDESGRLGPNGYRGSGMHLGQRFTSVIGGLGWPSMQIASDGTVRSEGFADFKVEPTAEGLKFEGIATALHDPPAFVAVEGLAEGRYQLSIDGKPVRTASSKEWTEVRNSVRLYQHPDYAAYEALRQAIIAKNELYFHSWRPQNVTYLFGFRKHEQGQNAKETAEFEKLVAEKEAEIARLKKPVPHKYELTREKPAK